MGVAVGTRRPDRARRARRRLRAARAGRAAALAGGTTGDPQPPTSASRRSTAWLVLAVVVVAFVLRALTAQGDFATTDENNWLSRSHNFRESVAAGDFASATATAGGINADADVSTMPGVTTMWVGAVGELVWTAAHGAGLVGDRPEPDASMVAAARADPGLAALFDRDTAFTSDPSGLDIAQLAMAVASALALGVLVALVAVWAGRTVAAVAGLLVATEPFLVAHGAVLHTDSLTTLFGAAALVAGALALGVPRPTSWAGRWWAGATAGLLFGLALLTKLTALTVLPGAALLFAWALAGVPVGLVQAWRRAPAGPPRARARVARAAVGAAAWPALRSVALVTAAAAGAAAVTVVALYPALWVAPMAEARALRRSMDLGASGHVTFFRGRVVETPGMTFYPVALSLRMTPWFLAATAVACLAVWRRSTRRLAAAVACMGVPTLVLLSLADKQLDRYGLPVLVTFALAVGLATRGAAEWVEARRPERRPVAVGVAAAAAVLVTAHSLAIAPWGLAYYDTVLGGGPRAVNNVLVGWSEGVEQAGALIAERERGHCAEVTIRGPWIPQAYSCGRLSGAPDATYAIVYINVVQRLPDQRTKAAEGRTLVATIEERGIPYAWVYGPRRPISSREG